MNLIHPIDNILNDWKSHVINPNRRRVCIVVPHPDDFDLLTGHSAQYFIQCGWQVYEILMTYGEYGVVNRFGKEGNHLKGKFLQKLRSIENSRSKAVYGRFDDGTPKVFTIPMRFIDGYVPLNAQSISKLQTVISHIKPNIILGPDPIFSIDWHKDHMATARNCFFAIMNMETKNRPKYYFLFQTFRSNWHWPIQSWDIFIQANLQHRSQMSPLMVHGMASLLGFLYKIFRKNKTGLRKVLFWEDKSLFIQENQFNQIFDWIIYALLFGNKPNSALYTPSPEELGL